MNERERNSQGYTYNRNSSYHGGAQPPRRPAPPSASRPNPNRRPPQGKKKLRFNPNKEGLTALAILLIIAVLAITVIVLAIKGIANAISGADETTTEQSTTESTTAEPTPVATWHDGYVKQAMSSADIAVGNLILVNFENKYDLTDTISSKLSSLYSTTGYGSYFVLHDASMKIRRDIKTSLCDMITDLVDSQPTLGTTKTEDRVIIISGHRTTEYQQDLYDKQLVDNYVAIPGHSEHHTGLAVDLKVFGKPDENGYNPVFEFREEEQAWMEANCAKYGFILRYDGAKFELTGILDETWHFRYVGAPHAQYITENGLCLEEYLTLLRTDYNYETCETPLTYTAGEDEYIIYYVPASVDSITDVPVPKADTVSDISISGDNMNGFIVTVKK